MGRDPLDLALTLLSSVNVGEAGGYVPIVKAFPLSTATQNVVSGQESATGSAWESMLTGAVQVPDISCRTLPWASTAQHFDPVAQERAVMKERPSGALGPVNVVLWTAKT